MRLIASLIVRNELSRFLEPCVRSLLTFCDEVRAYDDGSTDGTLEWLQAQPGVAALPGTPDGFYLHEGRARSAALAWALHGHPTHLLAVDADEFVTDGQAVRAACEQDAGRGAWSLGLYEVWKADERRLHIREDGGWRAQEHGVPILWRVPPGRVASSGRWQVADRALACGRAPVAVGRLRATPSGADLLHFGWANEAERAARYQRYVQHDGGRFHARKHLDSIMWRDDRVKLTARPWPDGVDKQAILARTRAREPVA